MTDKFWVGGSGNTNDTAHWSLTSGGTGGAAAPGSGDDIFFDGNSDGGGGNYTVTVNATFTMRNFTTTAPSSGNMTLAGASAINCHGSLSWYSGMVRSYTGAWTFTGTTGASNTIEVNGLALTTNTILFNTNNKSYTIVGTYSIINNFRVWGGGGNFPVVNFGTSTVTLSSSGNIDVNAATLNFNSATINATSATALIHEDFATTNFGSSIWTAVQIQRVGSNSSFCNMNLGSAQITLSHANSPWVVNPGTFASFVAGTSLIKLTGNSGGAKNFGNGSGGTYYDVWNATTGTGEMQYVGTNTFHVLKINPGQSNGFDTSSTQTMDNLDAVGTSGNLITLRNDGGGSNNWNLVFTGAVDPICCDYLSVQRCQASGATFNAGSNSTDAGNNSGVNFVSCSESTGGRFGMLTGGKMRSSVGLHSGGQLISWLVGFITALFGVS